MGDGQHQLLENVAEEFFSTKPQLVDFYRHRLRLHLWSGQEEIRKALKTYRFVAVASAHDLGKSLFAAAFGCEWIETHESGEAFLVSTAPTTPQVNVVLWRYIERLHRQGNLKGRITMGRIPEWIIGKQQVGYGRKPQDYDRAGNSGSEQSATGFQGVHALYPCIIVDEAAGISGALWTAIKSLATNLNARVLAIGNPDDANSTFATICSPGSGWYVIHLDGLTSPNMTEDEVRAASNILDEHGLPLTGDLYQYFVDNNIPFSTEPVPYILRQELLSPRWVGERMLDWGCYKEDDIWKESGLWQARVRGNFPKESQDGVIPHSWVIKAVERWKQLRAAETEQDQETETSDYRPSVYGVDVAREGDDMTVVSERVGLDIRKIERWAKHDTQTTARRVAHRLDGRAGNRAVVDVVAVGSGVVDRLREDDYDVTAFNGSAAADYRDHSGEFGFNNTRSAAWWYVRELLDPSNPSTSLALPDDPLLIADLTTPKYEVRAGAKIVVEEKTQVKKRLRRSPDTGDSVVMCLWRAESENAVAHIAEYHNRSPLRHDYKGDDSFIAGESDFAVTSFVMAGWGDLLGRPDL